MNKKYRLLKDLPDVKSGAVFTLIGNEFVYKLKESEGRGEYQFNQDEINNNPDWFEEVKDEKELNESCPKKEKIHKGDLMQSSTGTVVVYTGKGKTEGTFSGYVIKETRGVFKSFWYSRNWLLTEFFKPAQ